MLPWGKPIRIDNINKAYPMMLPSLRTHNASPCWQLLLRVELDKQVQRQRLEDSARVRRLVLERVGCLPGDKGPQKPPLRESRTWICDRSLSNQKRPG
jgi:hypothetical protein